VSRLSNLLRRLEASDPRLAADLQREVEQSYGSGTGTGRRIRSLAICVAAMAWIACPAAEEPPVGDRVGGETAELEGHEVELAVLMGELQRHSAKLGYAIEGRHPELARFYFQETGEALDGIRAVESWEGMPIAEPLETIVDPLLPPLRQSLETGLWDEAALSYEALIEGCNRCHAATEHEFLVIVPPESPPPYNQRFAAPGPGEEGVPAAEGDPVESEE
jgi:hypothetical protein